MMAKPLRIGRAKSEPAVGEGQREGGAGRGSLVGDGWLKSSSQVVKWVSAEERPLRRVIADRVEIAAGLAVIGVERQVPGADVLAVECRVSEAAALVAAVIFGARRSTAR